MKRRNDAFWGDDGNSVDFSQRHAGSTGSDGDDADSWMRTLRQAHPDHRVWSNPVWEKEVRDGLSLQLAGKDTTPTEDALLRQSRPEDEYTEQAERTTRTMERNPISGIPSDPDERRKFVEELAEQLRGRPAKTAQKSGEDEPGMGIGSIRLYDKAAHDKFWSDPEELKRVGKLVRPKL
jgi:hypothetical protein